jgi:hypothetical protein
MEKINETRRQILNGHTYTGRIYITQIEAKKVNKTFPEGHIHREIKKTQTTTKKLNFGRK